MDAGEWLYSDSSRFTLGEGTPVPTEYEAGLASEPVWTFWRKSNFFSVPEFSGQKMNTYILDLLPGWLRPQSCKYQQTGKPKHEINLHLWQNKTVARLGAGRSAFRIPEGQISLIFFSTSLLALWPIKPPVQRLPAFFLWSKTTEAWI
jgi:hypothetical protein